MYFSITNGQVSFGEKIIIDNINFEIKDKQKIAVVGRNGCGKTTLLRLVNGEIELSNGAVSKPNDISVGYLKQIVFEDENLTFETEVKKAFNKLFKMRDEMEFLVQKMKTDSSIETAEEYASLHEHFKLLGGYYYQKEYEIIVKKFGFTKQETQKKLCEFSGGQKTKIAFIKMLLSKPDILLLDEPTNHLDIETVEWLEEYLKTYPCSVVLVSHDRLFLDKIADIVYEIEHGEITKYNGNYTKFCEIKKNDFALKKKRYEQYKKETERLNELIERFRYKATKAAMAQSKIKYLERMEVVSDPEQFDTRCFKMDITPLVESGNGVLDVKNLTVGYENPLATINISLKKGDKLGVIGGNGVGKSTFLKTLVSSVNAISGDFTFGTNVKWGYFDQNFAQYLSDKTVLEDYWDEFPSLTQTEVRNDLGAFLFRNEDVFKPVNVLSGGEKVRLSLCKILKRKPNLLILDELTNHMDILGKETLEEMLKTYTGTIICVSHDRYFIKQVCNCLLAFQNKTANFYAFGFDEYSRKETNLPITENEPAEVKVKKKNTSPLKELSRLQTAVKQIERRISEKENEKDVLENELSLKENISDFKKLSEIDNKIQVVNTELETLYAEWEELVMKKDELESGIK